MAAPNDNNRNYGPYFDALFKNIEESKKQEAKNKLINDFGFIIEDEESEVTEKPEESEVTEKPEEPEVTDVNKEGSM